MEPQEIIFESKNKNNIIVDRGNEYALIAKRGEAVFDKNPIVLESVITAITQYGNAKWSNAPGCGFRFQDKNFNFICSLGHVVYAALCGQDMSFRHRRAIRYLDGDQFNLHLDNLDSRIKEKLKLFK